MKHLCLLASLASALFLASCSLTQQGADTTECSPQAKSLTESPDKDADSPGRSAEADGEEKQGEETAPSDASADTASSTPETALPTEEQQQAAAALLATTPAEAAVSSPLPPVISVDDDYPPTLPSGGLRMGSIMPQEDPASATDAPPPGANSVERSGLRSPKLPSGLPMDIDGKIQNAQ